MILRDKNEGRAGLKIKPIALAFLMVQLMDIITTWFGLTVVAGVREANPMWGGLFLPVVKFITIVDIALILQKFELSRLAWIIPAASAIPVVWNLFILVIQTVK